jgi:non-structural maintenance of chromosomes element 4
MQQERPRPQRRRAAEAEDPAPGSGEDDEVEVEASASASAEVEISDGEEESDDYEEAQAQPRRGRGAARGRSASRGNAAASAAARQQRGAESAEAATRTDFQDWESAAVTRRLEKIRTWDKSASESSKAYEYAQAHEQKRALRNEVRLQSEFLQDNRRTLTNPDDDHLRPSIIAATAMSRLAKQTREASMIAENIQVLSGVLGDKARNVKTSFKARDPLAFVDAMVRHMQRVPRQNQDLGTINTQFSQFEESTRRRNRTEDHRIADLQDKLNWDDLASQVLDRGFFSTTFSPDCMYGPLEHPPERRKQQERRKRDDVEEPITRPEEVDRTEQVANVNDKLTEERVASLHKHLRHATRDCTEAGKPLKFWGFILNPDSFTETVENLFHFAFLLRDGKAKLSVPDGGDGDGDIIAESVNVTAEEEDHRRRQAVVSIDFPAWRRMCDQFPTYSPRLPPGGAHRKGAGAGAAASGSASASASASGATSKRASSASSAPATKRRRT